MSEPEPIPGRQPAASPPESIGQQARREVIDLVKAVVLFLVLFLLVRSFVLESYPVQGDSMLPTLVEGDRILVFKLPAGLQRLPLLRGIQPLEPGDIVVFDSPVEADRRYVKRVVAVAPESGRVVRAATGESPVLVSYVGGELFVNNQRVREDYVVFGEDASPGRHTVSLSPGHIFVLGDHRKVSRDSRHIGPIGMRYVVGRAVLRFWPLAKFGLL